MSMSKTAKKAYKKAVKAKKKAKRGHWLLIQKGDSVKEIASKLFTQFAVLVLIACGVILINEFRLSYSAQQLNSTLKNLYQSYVAHNNDGEILQGAEEMLKINSDTVGYICISGTEIDFPVVQTSDNEKYLKTAFDGSSNKAGTVFLDYRNILTSSDRSDNLVLYGHNQKDRTMFGSLKDYKKNINHYRAHPTITFNSNYESDVYKIFAYFVTEVEPHQTSDGIVFDYHNYLDLSDKEVYNRFIDNIMLRSQVVTAVDVEYGDEFLTLSTCSNEFEPSRFVVFARKTRSGEDTAVDTSAAYLNPEAKEPDWNVIFR
ncbi:MAG: class B sortase [Oscillospiraceae bacterium]|nr:class B sortase [Oscillospiraceae bacterium]